MDSNYKEIFEENKRRNMALDAPYDPITGLGSPLEREEVSFSWKGRDMTFLATKPFIEAMSSILEPLRRKGCVEAILLDIGDVSDGTKLMEAIWEAREKYDFEFWAVRKAKVQDKKTKAVIPFVCNRPQREALAVIEDMRSKGLPIRIIVLKARQMGMSTLIQIYMAWLQLMVKENWHSVIVADVETQTGNIRGMYSRLLAHYPVKYEFSPYEGSVKNKIIKERGCIISVGSAQRPETLRSADAALCHMSELASWKTTELRSADDLIQTIIPLIPDEPDTMIAKESTAKGVGNFFHRDWLAAINGDNEYRPIFIPWYHMGTYRKRLRKGKEEEFVRKMLDHPYMHFLWKEGATLEGINWYMDWRKADNWTDWRMQSEYPTTWLEAFQSTNRRVFAPDYVAMCRKSNKKPAYIGDVWGKATSGAQSLVEVEFREDTNGLMWVWSEPEVSNTDGYNKYVVSVDIGGRTEKADWSVIRVIDRSWFPMGGNYETCATWRGHIDQDLLAWKAAQIARLYGNAMLVVEANSLDKQQSDAGHFITILDEIVGVYPNIYARTDQEKVRQGLPIRYGFHTGKAEKTAAIDNLNALVRDGRFTEFDGRVCDEMDTYEVKANGSMGAVDGCHDDMVMSTAIGLWVAAKYLPPYEEMGTGGKWYTSSSSVGAASM